MFAVSDFLRKVVPENTYFIEQHRRGTPASVLPLLASHHSTAITFGVTTHLPNPGHVSLKHPAGLSHPPPADIFSSRAPARVRNIVSGGGGDKRQMGGQRGAVEVSRTALDGSGW